MRTQIMKMHLLMVMMMMMMMYFSAMIAGQPACDPLTQYEVNGQCCKMCGPGTRMSSLDNCQDPQCIECGNNDYQDKYTTETKCQRQPYCDPHKNFDVVDQKSKVAKSICLCKEGFHCSSEACITCVPHTPCQPGHGARLRGNHTHNTVCQKCAEGTFSKDRSWSGVCEKWTECLEGYHVEQSGTDTSDIVCEETLRSHTVVIVVLSVMGFLLVVIFALVCIWKAISADSKRKMKVCVESCLVDKKELPREAKGLMINPTDPIEEESMFPDQQSHQEESGLRTPEENEDQLNLSELSDDFVLTEHGNFVAQENGKSVILSRQESQTQAFTD